MSIEHLKTLLFEADDALAAQPEHPDDGYILCVLERCPDCVRLTDAHLAVERAKNALIDAIRSGRPG